MREVDRLMGEEFHIELLQMMELAGRHLAHLARERFLGELYLANIGVPRTLYALPTLGVEVGPIFAKTDVVRLR
jgi:hypothetical protein